MFRILNITENRIILDTPNSIEFVNYTKKIFNENGDNLIMQTPTSILGCCNYIIEYCTNLHLFVDNKSKYL